MATNLNFHDDFRQSRIPALSWSYREPVQPACTGLVELERES
jgi:hypothetical protein